MLCALVRKESDLAAKCLERWPSPRLYDDRVYYFRSLPFDYDNTVLASEWLDSDDEPLKGGALFQKAEAAIQADHELAVLISKGSGQALYMWMVEAGLIAIESI